MHLDPELGSGLTNGNLTVTEAQKLHEAINTLGIQVSALATNLKAIRSRVVIIAGIIVLVFASLVGVIALTVHVNHVSACQARQNDAFRDVANQSRASRDTQDNAQIVLLNTTLDPTLTPDQHRAAITKYLNQIRAAQQSRANNPFPDGNCA